MPESGADHGSIYVPGSRSNNLLRFGLLSMVVLTSVWAFTWNHGTYILAVDINIPLQAADRWLAGGTPYVAADFAPGAALPPFMYPPYILPLVAPLTLLPRSIVDAAWVASLVVAACWTLRTLGVPWRAWPPLFVWPPLAEPIFNGNVQVLLLAAFVALFYRYPGIPRNATDPPLSTAGLAALAVVLPAIKVGQFHAWIHVLARRPRAALLGLGFVAVVALLTLSLVGLSSWAEWLAQLGRARDPRWVLGGFSLIRLVPPLGYPVILACAVAAWFVRGPHAGAIVGALLVVGAPSLYIFVTLMLLPAMVTIRREVALLGAIFIATSTYAGAWIGILIVSAAIAATSRQPRLLEPRAEGRPAAGRAPTPAG